MFGLRELLEIISLIIVVGSAYTAIKIDFVKLKTQFDNHLAHHDELMKNELAHLKKAVEKLESSIAALKRS